MTAVIASGDFSIDTSIIGWLRSVAPDIESVTMADSTSQMCASVAASSVPVVTMVDGSADLSQLHDVALTFVAGCTRGGVLAVGKDASGEHVTQAFLSGRARPDG